MINGKAYREGFIDGLLGRPSKNPYNWFHAIAMASYAQGYFTGKERREHSHITLTYEETV